MATTGAPAARGSDPSESVSNTSPPFMGGAFGSLAIFLFVLFALLEILAFSARLAGGASVMATPGSSLGSLETAAARADEPPGSTPEGMRLSGWILKAGDNSGQAYAVIDKRAARVMLFSPGGELVASSQALLGIAVGDESAPGVGEKPLGSILESEKTTPAGRFVSEPGVNANGEDVVWIDYAAAVSLHRVRATNPAERRLERLASPTSDDNRISFGCVNVPAVFFDAYLQPNLGAPSPLIYVLPETRSLAEQFPALAKRAGA